MSDQKKTTMTPHKAGYCVGGQTSCARFGQWKIGGEVYCLRHAKDRIFELAKTGEI